MSVLSSAHNTSSLLDSSSMVALANTTVGGDTLGGSYMHGDSSMLHESHTSGRGDYSAAKLALASISAALSPMGAGASNSSRQMSGGTSRMVSRDQYSVPPPGFAKEGTMMHSHSSYGASRERERMASVASAVREDVGSKRMRESFAPEPSPLLASDRRNVGGAPIARPAKRRGISQSSNTVKKIMDIIKDTSTSHTDARATPSSRFFNSSSVYASRQTQGAEYDDDGDSSFLASSPVASGGVGGKRAAAQSNGKFSFKEPEATEFAVKASSNMWGGSSSCSTFVFSEPSDRNDAGGDDEADADTSFTSKSFQKGSGNASESASAQGASSSQLSLADLFKAKPGEWDCPKCMTRNKAEAKFKCMACEEAKPGAPSASAFGASAGSVDSGFQFGTKAPAAAKPAAPAISSGQPTLADMFKPKPGEWDCKKCMTRNKADANFKCMSCEEPKPGADAAAAGASAAPAAAFTFGSKAPVTAAASSGASTGFTFGTSAPSASAPAASTGGGFSFGTKSADPAAAPATSTPLTFGFKPTASPTASTVPAMTFGTKPAAAADAPKAAAASTASDAPKANMAETDLDKKKKALAAEEAKKKGWVTSGFQWPDKKVDVAFESTGSKELDQDDAAEGFVTGASSITASAPNIAAKPAAAAPAASTLPTSSPFAFGTAAPTGGSAPISSVFSFNKTADSCSSGASPSAFSFGGSGAKTEATAAAAPSSAAAFSFGSATSPSIGSTSASSGASSFSSSAPVFAFGSSTALSGAAGSSSAAPALGASAGTLFACLPTTV